MNYIPVIGLEIHAELLTKSKVFCSCANEFGGQSNTRVCPVCSGMPGALPTLNKDAVKLAIKAGLSLGCKINNYSSFDRKNYFYPDLPKAYQITQQAFPICSSGNVKIHDKNIQIERIHIEEDAGKLTHTEDNLSLIDYNRCGVGLIEIVTKPDFRSADEVVAFVDEVCLRLKYSGVCDGRLAEGSLRVDVNISVMSDDSDTLGTRTEIKNLNSLKSIKKAIEYETKRQIELINNGEKVVMQTRRFDEETGTTILLRTKETAPDYRFHTEPDLPPIYISDEQIEKIKNEMPKMPDERFLTYTQDYNLPKEDALLIIKDKDFSDFYDETAKIIKDYKSVKNLMLGELNHYLNKNKISVNNLKITPQSLAELIKMCNDKIVTKNDSKSILKIMLDTGKNAYDIASENNFIVKDNIKELALLADEILLQNPDNVLKYKNGKLQLLGFFVGQLLKKAGKGTNPVVAKNILLEKLNK